MKKYTTEEFIERARKVHGDKYDYSKVEYIKSDINVIITCPIHGDFSQAPREHLRGQGCSECSNCKKKTTERFIEEARKVHGDKYDYSKVEYVNNHTNVTIICPIHGEFPQTPDKHLHGQGCSKCSKKKKKTTEEFIREAKLKHREKYNYSKVNYVNNWTDVDIICPIHGIFPQNPKAHLNGCGCPKCNSSHLENEIRIFLKEKNIVFNEQYKPIWLKPLSLDFYLLEFNIAIECQGEQHFKGWNGNKESLKEITERDNKKRQLCEENGIQLLYYSNLNIEYPYNVYENKKELLNEIRKT